MIYVKMHPCKSALGGVTNPGIIGVLAAEDGGYIEET